MYSGSILAARCRCRIFSLFGGAGGRRDDEIAHNEIHSRRQFTRTRLAMSHTLVTCVEFLFDSTAKSVFFLVDQLNKYFHQNWR